MLIGVMMMVVMMVKCVVVERNCLINKTIVYFWLIIVVSVYSIIISADKMSIKNSIFTIVLTGGMMETVFFFF